MPLYLGYDAMVITVPGVGMRQGVQRWKSCEDEGAQPKSQREKRKSPVDFRLSQ